MCLSHLIYTVRPCLIHTCHAYAMLRPCRSSQGHGTARLSIDDLWAVCPRSATSGYHAELHEGCYQTHTNLCRWPEWNQTPFVMDEEKSGSSTLQKKTTCYTVGLAVRIFPATMRIFTKDTALSEQGRGAAWHVWINTRHGKGTGWAWQGNWMGMACYVWICLKAAVPPCGITSSFPIFYPFASRYISKYEMEQL